MTTQALNLKQVLKAAGCTRMGSKNISVATTKGVHVGNGSYEYGPAKCHVDLLTPDQQAYILVEFASAHIINLPQVGTSVVYSSQPWVRHKRYKKRNTGL